MDLNCSIDKELSNDNFQKLKQFRQQASSICLNCVGKECEMKSWQKEQAGDATVCVNYFFVLLPKCLAALKGPMEQKKEEQRLNLTTTFQKKGKSKT